MFNRVIIGDDGAAGGRDAIALARVLAPQAELVLVLVYPYDAHRGRAALADYGDLLRQDAEAALQRSRHEHGIPDARLVAIADLVPAHGLQRIAVEEQADLIVVGSSRLGKVGRAVLGDVARATLHGAPCAVLVAPRDVNARPPDRIGVAFDGSAEARRALAVAAEVAQLHRAHLVVRHVVDPEVFGPAGTAFVIDLQELRDGLLREAQARVQSAVADLDLHDVEASAVVGTTTYGLQALAETADLIICGSRGRGTLRRVFLGSRADYLIHHAACPVLVVPRPASGSTAGVSAASSAASGDRWSAEPHNELESST